jgi:hypothetical protein
VAERRTKRTIEVPSDFVREWKRSRTHRVLVALVESAPGGLVASLLLVPALGGASVALLSALPNEKLNASGEAFLHGGRVVGAVLALLALAAARGLDARGERAAGHSDESRAIGRRVVVLLCTAVLVASSLVASDNDALRRTSAFVAVLVGASALRGVFVVARELRGREHALTAELLIALATLPLVVDLVRA